ncbi:hypothetical protein ZIOFF_058016 [Zingiber officinale]|uniref:Endoglucanase n=1 Tax=Zingiber officinale TaxID=94328 RepID=A0A8J5FA75_ZINOF|nr:hypothetical protein ZIOFF_058016 [Zingiber officinale]
MSSTTSLLTTAILLLLLSDASAGGYNYREALDKSLLFFEAQRSGKLPAVHRVPWRGDSGLRDGFGEGVDLVGGYYDSGDHVKFGLPMAYAVTMLAWGVVEFEKEILAAGQLDHALDAIRWGTDYFLKAHNQPDILWVQVGDGDTDHLCWERAEDMDTPRTAYKIDCDHPGSEVAAETAAALAAATVAFKPYDSEYSDLLILHARQDELLWAAAWLFEATNDKYYLNYVAKNAAFLGGTGWAVTEFSWDNKYAGLQLLLTKQYKAKAEYFLCACLQKNNGGDNVDMTPGGLLYFQEWQNLQYVSSAAFLMVVYSHHLTMENAILTCPGGQVTPGFILKFAQSQADYILGENPKSMSYLVGYGDNYPTHVHHRGASIPSIHTLPEKVGCIDGFDNWYANKKSNPNIIEGALVGGPNSNDEFYDERDMYEQNEASVGGNAPLLGLFAVLDSLATSPDTVKNKTKSHPKPNGEPPVKFIHAITNTWTYQGKQYYRHVVTVKNTGAMAISYLELKIEGLTGPLWGLSATHEQKIYELPSWLKQVEAGSKFEFVYIQGGQQAKVSLVRYTEAT